MLLSQEKTLSKLKRSGYKATSQRVAVLQAIAGSDEHLTPAALYHKVRLKHPRIGLVTIYRTLNTLARLGLICRVPTSQNEWGYVRSSPQHHDHVICSGCGKVVDFTGCNLGALGHRLSRETGFTIEDHHLEFYGKCHECHHKD